MRPSNVPPPSCQTPPTANHCLLSRRWGVAKASVSVVLFLWAMARLSDWLQRRRRALASSESARSPTSSDTAETFYSPDLPSSSASSGASLSPVTRFAADLLTEQLQASPSLASLKLAGAAIPGLTTEEQEEQEEEPLVSQLLYCTTTTSSCSRGGSAGGDEERPGIHPWPSQSIPLATTVPFKSCTSFPLPPFHRSRRRVL